MGVLFCCTLGVGCVSVTIIDALNLNFIIYYCKRKTILNGDSPSAYITMYIFHGIMFFDIFIKVIYFIFVIKLN